MRDKHLEHQRHCCNNYSNYFCVTCGNGFPEEVLARSLHVMQCDRSASGCPHCENFMPLHTHILACQSTSDDPYGCSSTTRACTIDVRRAVQHYYACTEREKGCRQCAQILYAVRIFNEEDTQGPGINKLVLFGASHYWGCPTNPRTGRYPLKCHSCLLFLKCSVPPATQEYDVIDWANRHRTDQGPTPSLLSIAFTGIIDHCLYCAGPSARIRARDAAALKRDPDYKPVGECCDLLSTLCTTATRGWVRHFQRCDGTSCDSCTRGTLPSILKQARDAKPLEWHIDVRGKAGKRPFKIGHFVRVKHYKQSAGVVVRYLQKVSAPPSKVRLACILRMVRPWSAKLCELKVYSPEELCGMYTGRAGVTCIGVTRFLQ